MKYVQERLEGGRELVYGAKQGAKDLPLITIITSTFNAANDLHWTIDSIRSQTYPNIQWIVVDGGSTDGTVELLKENEDIIDFWFSKPDKGIYDAWNKALKHVSGEWIQFLGAGDELASKQVISEISAHLKCAYPNHNLVYGSINIISEKNRVLLEHIGEPWETLKEKWHGIRPALPMHPEVFHHKSIFEGLDFSGFKIAGDSYIMLSAIMKKTPLYIDVLVNKMPYGGVSTRPKNIILVYKELVEINKLLSISPPLMNLQVYRIKMVSKYLILKYLGFSFFCRVADIFRVLTKKNKKWTVD